MPTFRTAPTSNLNASIRRLVASGGGKLNALGEMQADMAAARTQRDLNLADKARIEAEALRNAEVTRRDPASQTQYASDVAGLDTASGTRLYKNLRGVTEQPGPADIDDANMAGKEAVPYVTSAPDLQPGQRDRFQGALASTMANLLATGKTNAQQLTAAGGNLQKQRIRDEATRAPDVETGNRLIAAMEGKLRNPNVLGRSGQVLNRETGEVNEDTALATAAAELSGARTSELGTRSGRNTASADLAAARAEAVRRGATDKGGKRVSPEQVERWINQVALNEWKELPASKRRGMNYEQHLGQVRARFQATPQQKVDPVAELDDARQALEGGASRDAVAKRFKERTGLDLPEDEEPEEE